MSDDYSLQRLRGQYAIVWYEDGKRRRYSLGTADRASAEAAARSLWARRTLKGELHTVGEAVRVYLADKASMASIKRATQAWGAASAFWDNLPIARVDEKTPEDYGKRRAHCKPVTIRNELAVIRAALNHAEHKKLIGKAPFVQMPKLPESEVGHLTKPQFRKLLAGARRPHVRLFMEVAAGTGARSNAILDLQWSQVDFERNIIRLNPAERVQTAKYRATVPMNKQLRAILLAAKEGALSEYVIEHGRGKVASIKKGFAAACVRAKIAATPHMLRHSAAVWMAEDRRPMPEIARFLGHTDSRITERVYAKFSPDFLAESAESLTW